MEFYYCILETRNQVFLIEKRLKAKGILCQLEHVSPSLTKNLCNLAIKFNRFNFKEVSSIVSMLNFPGYKFVKG